MPTIYIGKITEISKPDSNGIATVTYDMYKNTNTSSNLLGKGYSTQGSTKEIIKDNIKEALRKYKETDKEISGLNVGDEITIGG